MVDFFEFGNVVWYETGGVYIVDDFLFDAESKYEYYMGVIVWIFWF